MAANRDAMGDLHVAVAEVLTKALKETYRDGEGNYAPPPAHVLKTAIEFLKNNGIESTNAPGSATSGVMEAALPFLDGNDETVIPFSR